MLHKCLNFEIRSTHRKHIRLSHEYKNNLQQFRESVSWFDYRVLLSKLTKDNVNKINHTKEVHNKKLKSLGVPSTGVIDADKVIFNFSNRILSNEEKEILKLGLQFGFAEKKS